MIPKFVLLAIPRHNGDAITKFRLLPHGNIQFVERMWNLVPMDWP